MLSRFFTLTLLFAFSLTIQAQITPKISNQNQTIKNHKILQKYFTDYSIVDIDVSFLQNQLYEDGSMQTLNLTLGNEKFTFNIWANQSINDRSVINTASGNVPEIKRPKAYQGFLTNNEGNVRLTLNDNYLYGFIKNGKSTLYIEPLNYFVEGAKSNLFIVYDSEDVIPIEGNTCAATITHGKVEEFSNNSNKSASAVVCKELELAIADDYLMFQDYGSVAGVINHNTAVMNNVQGNWDNEFTDEIQFIIVENFVVDCSGCDPWTSNTDAGIFLGSFTNWGPSGFSATHDLGQIWTARDFDGSTIGIAWVGVVCQGSRYHALSDFSSNANLLRVMTSHEIGHNFSAGHDASGSPHIMAPTVQNTSTWSTASENAIQTHINSRTCLSGCAPPAPPTSDFEAAITDLCVGSPTQFYDMSVNNPTSWTWSFQGGTPASSSQQNPVVVYNTPGTFLVSLTTSNANGADTESKSGYITVSNNGSSFVHIIDDFESGLANWSVTNPDNSDTWSIESAPGSKGGNSTASVPNFDYDADGQLDGLESQVLDLTEHTSLTFYMEYAYARYNSSFSDIFRLKVSTNGGSSFTTVFTGQETGGGNWATNPDLTSEFEPTDASEWCDQSSYGPGCLEVDLSAFAGSDNVVIRLENENGYGNNIFIDNVIVYSDCAVALPPIPEFVGNPSSGCAPLIVSFTDLSTNNPESYLWQFPGGSPATSTAQNPIVIYNNMGDFNVSLTVTNSAGSVTETKTNYISVNDVPVANFVPIINGSIVTFTNTSSDNADFFSWDFGDGTNGADENPVHNYTEDGTYVVTLIASNECGSDTYFTTIEISTVPTAGFTTDVTSGCVPLTVQFTDISSANTTEWLWTFEGGNPSSSTEENPVVVYENAGSFDVTLEATNEYGSDVINFTDYILVDDVPIVDFDYTIDDLEVSFTNNSSNGDEYLWEFGDGNTSTLGNPLHEYEEDGIYTVSLTVSNDCGESTTTKTLNVSSAPTAGFAADVTSGCTPFVVNFIDQSSSNTTDWFWTFEGGTPATSTEQNPAVTYNSSGVFNVTLEVSNDAGSDIISQTDYIIVGVDPVADFDLFIDENNVDFINQSNNADSYFWEFGDGETSGQINPIHTYDEDGTYTVTLTATNGCGSSTSTFTITIVTPVSADATAGNAQGCEPFEVQFQNLSSNNATDFFWTFEGGIPATSSSENPSVMYNEAGVYDVTLIASNSEYSDTVELNNYIVVALQPDADFSFDIDQQNVTFDNNSENGDTYFWEFGDGETSNQENPSHTYDEEGNYTIILTVTNDCGSDTKELNINVSSLPTADFTYTIDDQCVPFQVQFTNQSSGNSDDIEWVFEGGSPASSTEMNPLVTYTVRGEYSVTLIASNESGDDELILQDLIIAKDVPIADFTYVIDGNSVIFTNESQYADSYEWEIDDLPVITDENPTVEFDDNGDFEAILTAFNECGETISTKVVSITGIPNPIIVSDKEVGCAPLTVLYEDQTIQEVVTREWTFEGGTPATSSDEEVSVIYETPGIYNVSLYVENEIGENSLVLNNYVEVFPLLDAEFTFEANGLEVAFEAIVEGGADVKWYFGDSNTSEELNPVHVYSEAGQYEVILEVIDENCQNTFTDIVDVIVATAEINDVSMSLYPNPNQGDFTIELNYDHPGDYKMNIFNNLGQAVEEKMLYFSIGKKQNIQTNLVKGSYFVVLENEGSRFVFKLIIQ